jgi:hypothetical protein
VNVSIGVVFSILVVQGTRRILVGADFNAFPSHCGETVHADRATETLLGVHPQLIIERACLQPSEPVLFANVLYPIDRQHGDIIKEIGAMR